ncbi:MAG: AsmA family protein [Stellaceae bacterium]
MKKLLIGVAILIVLVIAVAVAAPFFIPLDTYKGELIAAVKQSTGRDLAINGKMSFSLLPSLALEADDVAFANPPGASSPQMATLTKLEVQLKLLPLLSRRVEVDKLVLVDPVIALEVDKQGKPNWQFAQAAPTAAKTPGAAQPQPAPAASGGGATLSGLSLDDVRLENGQISYVDQRSGEKVQLEQIAMTLSLPDLDSPFKADGSAVYRGEKLSLSIALANPRAFLEGKSSAAQLGLDSKPIAFAFTGNAAGSTPAKLDGAVELKIPSLRGLAQWAGSPLNAPGTGFGPFTLSGKVSYAGPKIGFTEASLSLDQINAKGELALDTGGARPVVKGRLDVDKLDANPYLPPETPSKPAAPSSGGGGVSGSGAGARAAGWSDQPIDVSALKTADVDFSLSANSLLYRKIQIGKSALGLHLKDGRFEADLTELALYQGTGKGKVAVDGSGAVPAIEAEFNLSKVQMEPLLKDAMDLDRLSGSGAFDMAVTGRGRSEREIIGALNGKGDLNLANGKIKGVNLAAMVKNVASAFQGDHDTQETDFASLSGTYTIQNGILHNTDLQLKSADLPMTGAGTVDLPQRSADYKITPRIAGAIAVPVIVKGPWDNLSYEPDLAGLVGDPAKLLKSGAGDIGNTLKSAPGGAGNVLKGLLGGSKN